MKKTLIVALMMIAGGAQAACESEQKIINNPNLPESSRTVWVKQLASCLENAKERAIADEKYAAEAKIREEELAEKQKQKEAKWNSFKEPEVDSPTYWRDKYAQEVGRNKLIEEEFGEQCIERFSKKLDKWCLIFKSNYKYQDPDRPFSKRMADEEPAQVASRIAYAAEEKKRQAEVDRLAKLPGVRIGMTSNQVINQTSWGRPSSVNRTTTSAGTREQWVYGSRTYLYFTNSILTAIQN